MRRVPLPRSLRQSAVVLGVLAAFVALTVGLAAWLLRPEALRVRLAAALETALERPVSVAGPVRLRLATRPSVSVAGLDLPAVDGVALAVDRVDIGTTWRDVLDGRIALGTVRVVSPRLVVHGAVSASPEGSAQADVVVPADGASPGARTPAIAMSAAPRHAWSIARLELVDGRFEWSDARVGRAATLDDVQATVDGLAFDGAPGGYRVARARLTAALDPGPAPLAPGRYPIAVDVAALDYASATGALRAEAVRIAALGVDLRLDEPTASLAAPATYPAAPANHPGARAAIPGAPTASSGAPTPVFDGRLSVAPFDPRAVLGAFGRELPPMQGPDALGRAEFAASVALRDGTWRLDGLALALDDSRLSGHAVLRPAERPWLALDVAVDRLDAERYRKPLALRVGEPLIVPFERLRALDVEGRLRIGELRVGGAVLRGTTVELRP